MRLQVIPPALLCLVLLGACSPLDVAKSLIPGGKGVNTVASVQAGKNNPKAFGQNNITEQNLDNVAAEKIEQSTGSTRVRSDRVESVTVNEKDSPWLVITIALVSAFAAAGWIHGWLTPSPRERKILRELRLRDEHDKTKSIAVF